MFYRTIDKFFVQLKYLMSFITIVFIILSSILFIYWLLYCAKVQLPQGFETFIWGLLDFISFGFSKSKVYKDLIQIVPVLGSGIFIIFTYLSNCLILLLENNHKRFQSCMQVYKKSIETKINRELHESFLNDLKKTAFLMVKININVVAKSSYLNPNLDTVAIASELKKEITDEIFNLIPENIVFKKGIDNNAVYFLLTDFSSSKEFFTLIVSKSSQAINLHMREGTEITFQCAADVFDDISESNSVLKQLDRIISLKMHNKIVITPKFKLYFDNIYPDYFNFNVLGEYNINIDQSKMSCTLLHSLHRRI